MKRILFLSFAALVLLAGCSKPATDATSNATPANDKSAAASPSPSSVTAPGPPSSAIAAPKAPASTAVPGEPTAAVPPAAQSSNTTAPIKPGDSPSTVATAPKGGAATGKAYTLRVNEKVGEKHSYTIAMDMGLKLEIPKDQLAKMKPEQAAMFKGKQGFAFKGKMDSNVIKAGGGQFTFNINTKVQQFKGTGMFEKAGKMMTTTMSRPQEVTVDSQGTALSAGTAGKGSSPSMAGGGSNFGTGAIPFPKTPIRIGDSWDTTMALPNSPNMKMKAKFVKVESLKGREAVKLQYTVSGVPNMSMSGPLFVWIDPVSGRLLKLDANLKLKQGSSATGTMKLHQELVK